MLESERKHVAAFISLPIVEINSKYHNIHYPVLLETDALTPGRNYPRAAAGSEVAKAMGLFSSWHFCLMEYEQR